MGPRKDEQKRSTRSASVSTHTTGSGNTDMADASLATSHAPEETEANFHVFVRCTLRAIQDQMNNLHEEFKTGTSDLVKSLEFCTGQVKDLEAKITTQTGEIVELRRELSSAESTIRRQGSHIEHLETEKNSLETYMRKSNLIFDGCAEVENEDTTAIIENIINRVLNLNINVTGEVDKAHRFGQSVGGHPRPIIVKFLRHSVRDTVLKAANRLKDHPDKIYINEDLPKLIKARRAELRAVVQHAKTEGIVAKQTGDRITIAGQVYTHENLDCLPANLTLESACTKPIGDHSIGFYSKHSPLSNFYPSTFEMNNVKFNSVEQAYQSSKARVAGRDDIEKKIMAQTDCLSMMKLGNMVKPKRDSTWSQQKEEIMKSALTAKFSQNDTLRQKLDATGDRRLVETVRDYYWGSGVTLNSLSLINNTWTGQNRLGKLLTEVRSYLRTN